MTVSHLGCEYFHCCERSRLNSLFLGRLGLKVSYIPGVNVSVFFFSSIIRISIIGRYWPVYIFLFCKPTNMDIFVFILSS